MGDEAQSQFRVVIAGAGMAGLETALSLRELAQDRVAISIVAPEAAFTYRPLEVREPFTGASAPQYPLDELARGIGAALVPDRLVWVDGARRTVHTESGLTLGYDALVIALGARQRSCFEHARTVRAGRLDEHLHGFVRDVEGGYIRSAAFIAPDRMPWPLPLYELLLMTSERAAAAGVPVDLSLVTPESRPLESFGREAADAVTARLAAAGVRVIAGAHAEVPRPGLVKITRPHGVTRLEAESILALPELLGPGVRGLPGDARRFLPVDPHGRVRGADRVFAVGDAADHAIKFGGLALQQADAVARTVAGLAGADVGQRPFRPRLEGTLLTGGSPLPLRSALPTGEDFIAERSVKKVVGGRLGAYLDRRAPLPARREAVPSPCPR